VHAQGTCKYSHDYVLTPDQLATLASNAKKAPCNFLKNGAVPDGQADGAVFTYMCYQASSAHMATAAVGVTPARMVLNAST